MGIIYDGRDGATRTKPAAMHIANILWIGTKKRATGLRYTCGELFLREGGSVV